MEHLKPGVFELGPADADFELASRAIVGILLLWSNELSLLFTERNVDDIIPVVKKAKEAETILWQLESFGPVPALTAVDTVDEVVELDSTLKINSR
ncbi:hypothetical protein BGY98DRAFT_984100 [Russula aff. rugulosa BPL654]|nr:hypothetical protein BGY98DRAFT_984100 [Russula aff. rugulosa BPL654]